MTPGNTLTLKPDPRDSAPIYMRLARRPAQLTHESPDKPDEALRPVHLRRRGASTGQGHAGRLHAELDQALRNLVDTLGLSILEASKRVSTHAADYLGVADHDLKLQSIYIEGHSVEHTDAI